MTDENTTPEAATGSEESVAPEATTPEAVVEQDSQEKSGEQAGDENANESGSKPTDELTLTLPEGAEAYQGDLEAFQTDMRAFIKDNPEASAADVLNEAVRRQAKAVTELQDATAKAWTEQVKSWESEARSDKTIGGDAFDENVSTARAALDAYGGDELKDILNESGLGSHKAMIGFLMKVGAELKEASVDRTSGLVSQPEDALKYRYPSTTKQGS